MPPQDLLWMKGDLVLFGCDAFLRKDGLIVEIE